MSYDDPYDDEDWYHDDDEPDEEEPARCPECGKLVHAVTDKCPACGYWLSEADRRALRPGTDKPVWIKLTAAIVLIALLAGIFSAAAAFF